MKEAVHNWALIGGTVIPFGRPYPCGWECAETKTPIHALFLGLAP